jgi:dihydropyrimidine dehydrogenase (NAD+) subunit PreA
MGAAVGQVPEYCQQITSWVTEFSSLPVIVKLTPNVTDITYPARAAVAGGANALSLINTINSIVGVNLDTFELSPNIGGKGGHGGYAGPAVKPIALHLLSQVALVKEVSRAKLPISGMGGIMNWKDAAEFLLLGASSLQVCTAAMLYGYRIVEDMIDGLSNWLDEKGISSVNEIIGASLPRISDFGDFDLGFKTVARINQDSCIQCDLCYIACNDTEHQCIDLYRDGELVAAGHDARDNGKHMATSSRPFPVIRESDCVGCDLCHNVCPVQGCIEMVQVPSGREGTTWRQLSSERPEVTQDWEAMKAYRAEIGLDIH